MHFDKLTDWEDYEQDGWHGTKIVLKIDILEDSLVSSSPVVDPLDALDGVIGLLQDQANMRALGKGLDFLSSSDLRLLHDYYTKLGMKLHLDLPEMEFRDWESFERRYLVSSSVLARALLATEIASWFETPAKIVQKELRARWKSELLEFVEDNLSQSWPKVFAAANSLRRTYSNARDNNDYKGVGAASIALIDRLSDAVWSTGKYTVRPNEDDSPAATKNRLTAALSAELKGQEYEDIRGLVVKAIAFTHGVKHSSDPSRAEAAIAADTALYLAQLVWRVQSLDESRGT